MRQAAPGDGWSGVWDGWAAGCDSAGIGVVNGWALEGCSFVRPGCGQRLGWFWAGCPEDPHPNPLPRGEGARAGAPSRTRGGVVGAGRVVWGIGWGCGWVAGGGIWVGVKGELSLASPPPLGAGWREIAWAGFFGRVLATGAGAVRGVAGRGWRGRGRGRGAGWGRSESRGGGG